MKNSGWERFTDEATAAKYILDTGKYSGTLPPDGNLAILIPPNRPLRILDVCCGIGRNAVWLGKYRPLCGVVGYDLANMVALAKEYTKRHLGENKIAYTDDFDGVSKAEFDLALCTLSFQHVLPKYLDAYYPAISACLRKGDPGLLYVHGRDWSDHNDREIVWERLQRHFDLVPGHLLSGGFSGATFTKDYRAGDHHRAVFRPKGASR